MAVNYEKLKKYDLLECTVNDSKEIVIFIQRYKKYKNRWKGFLVMSTRFPDEVGRFWGLGRHTINKKLRKPQTKIPLETYNILLFNIKQHRLGVSTLKKAFQLK